MYIFLSDFKSFIILCRYRRWLVCLHIGCISYAVVVHMDSSDCLALRQLSWLPLDSFATCQTQNNSSVCPVVRLSVCLYACVSFCLCLSGNESTVQWAVKWNWRSHALQPVAYSQFDMSPTGLQQMPSPYFSFPSVMLMNYFSLFS